MAETLRLGEGVRTPSGNTGKVYSVKADGSKVKVRLATGAHAGQVREFNQSSLTSLDQTRGER